MRELNKFEKLLQQYKEKFNENYPLVPWLDMTEDEIINDIKQCIKSGEPAKEPEYQDGVDY